MNESEGQGEVWFKRFLALFIIGFFVVLLGVILLVAAAFLFGIKNASAGGIIWIFPFLPIVFGVGPEAHWLILIAVLLALLCVLMLFVAWGIGRKSSF
jgi:uncharacterized membrane protein